jgi:acyl transferase domain-containing protein/NAD(P)-dependent dehydrogenase (short-subunit alcohol dehydrogenase family)
MQFEKNPAVSSFSLPSGAYYATSNTAGKIGVIFPGQGSQYPGMGLELMCAAPAAFNALADADKTIGAVDESGNHLFDYIYPRPTYNPEKDKLNEEKLRATDIAQPAIGAVSLGQFEVLKSFGICADAFAGHSYGELVSLCAAGVYSGDVLARLSRQRGQLMAQGNGDRGGMIAVAADRSAVEAVLAEEKIDLVVANHNAPQQVVLSGKTSEIERAKELFKGRKLRATVLNVAGAFHSSFVADAAEPFFRFLEKEKFAKPTAAVYANTTAAPYPEKADEAKKLLGFQLANQVRFVEIIERMYADGIRTFIEVGPGGKMAGLIKSILGDRECNIIAVDSSAGKRAALTDMARVLAQLSACGYQLKTSGWQNGEEWLRQLPASTTARMTFPICGANHKGKAIVKNLEELDRPVTAKPTSVPVNAVPAAVSAPAPKPAANVISSSLAVSEPAGQSYGAPAFTTADNQALRATQTTLAAIQQLQQQTADLHRRFLEGQEQAQKTILSILNNTPVNMVMQPSAYVPLPVEAQQPFKPAQTPATPAARIVTAESRPAQPAAVATNTAKHIAKPAAATDSNRIKQTLLAVVSEKTGYPVDMLNLDMDMEADLGIDSIKRVEIMSAMQEKLPDAPVVQPDQLGRLRTLSQILEHLSVAGSVPTASHESAEQQKATGRSDSSRVKTVLIQVVSEKTGYPADMLNLDMDMEADLGIDSIKRVEIMSAMQERLPDAPVVQPDQLGRLRTLAQIIEHLGAAASSDSVSSARHITTGVSTTIQPVMLEIVSEKTGYPTDMLNLDMDMEADLGIDSIKRVEIMSAMQERLPDAPVVQPDQLGKLRTLAQIIDHLASGTNSGHTPAATIKTSVSGKIQPVLLEIVSEKTGYPTDMLNLDMDMEADLGIDSIKRVEIMSAMQERLPDAPVVQPDQLGKLRTLAQIIDHLASGTNSGHTPAATIKTSVSGKIQPVLLEIVSEKTGYPTDMLNLDMDMEADLGIDSIKRVEILSAFQERVPDAPVVQPGDLGKFRTISQILHYLNSSEENKSHKQPANKQVAAASATSAAAAVKTSCDPVRRTVLQSVEIDASPSGHAVLKSGQTILISNDDSELASALGDALAKHGIKTEIRSLEDIRAGRFSQTLDGLVLLSPQPEKAQLNLWEKQSEEWLKDVFMAAQSAGKIIKQRPGALFATVSRLDGAFALESATRTIDPIQGALAGLTKTIHHEWPGITARAIDLDYRFKDCSAAGEKLAAELMVAGPLETGLTKSARYGLQEKVITIYHNPAAPLCFQKGDVILVTGGARGVTAETAIAMADEYKTTMVLLGRSAAPTVEPAWLQPLQQEAAIKEAILKNSGRRLSPKELEGEYKNAMANREVLQNLQKIRNAGSRVFYYSVDIRDAEATAKIIEQARTEAGQIQGLIHGAGVLRDRRIEDKTRDQLDDVIDTKIAGLRNVLTATAKDNLKAIIMFSSFSGRFGRLGQVDYSMANEALNKAAQKLRILRPQCRTLSFNWGPWDGGMVTPALRNVFLSEGIGLIPLHEGARQPVIELSNPDENAVEIGIIGITDNKGGLDTGKKFFMVFEHELDPQTSPWLKDHVINGDPVLPMAVTAEILVHAAASSNHGLRFAGYDELRILKGIVLKSGGQKLFVYAASPEKSGSGVKVACEIRTLNGDRESVNARAVIILENAGTTASSSPAPIVADTHLVYPDSINEAYNNHLFHGEFLKALLKVEGWSEAGIAACTKDSDTAR